MSPGYWALDFLSAFAKLPAISSTEHQSSPEHITLQTSSDPSQEESYLQSIAQRMCCPSFLQISSFPDYLPQRPGNPGDVPEAHEKPSPCLSPSPEDAGLLCYMWDTGVA